MSKDDDVEESVDIRLVQTLPIPPNTGGLARLDLTPVRLKDDPPLYNTACKALEAIVRGEFVGSSAGGPPRDRLGPADCGEEATDGGAVGEFKRNVSLVIDSR